MNRIAQTMLNQMINDLHNSDFVQTHLMVEVNDANIMAIENILMKASTRYGLWNNTFTCRAVPNFLVGLTEGEYFGFGLSCRIDEDRFVFEFSRNKRPSDHFLEVVRFIIESLEAKFPAKLHYPDPKNYISLKEIQRGLNPEEKRRYYEFLARQSPDTYELNAPGELRVRKPESPSGK